MTRCPELQSAPAAAAGAGGTSHWSFNVAGINRQIILRILFQTCPKGKHHNRAMIRHTSTYVLLLALLFGWGCSTSYDPAAEPFKANFPGTPKKTKRTVSQNGMTLEIHYVGYDFGSGGFAVMYCDYPDGHVQKTGADKVLTGARNGAAASVGGQIISHKAISLGDHTGQEIKIADAAKGIETRNRMYLVGDRMYQVMVVAKGGNTDNPKADQFLDSFELK